MKTEEDHQHALFSAMSTTLRSNGLPNGKPANSGTMSTIQSFSVLPPHFGAAFQSGTPFPAVTFLKFLHDPQSRERNTQ
jgi:hypothetical protein